MVDYKKQGKRNQINGRIFENKVREDLEQSGWIVSRWCNNVVFTNPEIFIEKGKEPNFKIERKCIPAKQGRFRKTSTGFPDFIAYRDEMNRRPYNQYSEKHITKYKIIFVECKVGKYLDKEEKEKAKWYLENNYCSEFWVAYKETDPEDKRKNIVKYKEIKNED